jgi:hypothetical protein
MYYHLISLLVSLQNRIDSLLDNFWLPQVLANLVILM